jgi:hypothetical protein
MGNVSRQDVAAYFRDLQAAIQPERKPDPMIPLPNDAGTMDAHAGLDLETLALKAGELATGTKPAAITFPDGTTMVAASWRDLVCEILGWLGHQGKVPSIPFKGSVKGHRYFLNATPEHTAGQVMGEFRKLSLAGSDVYVDLHRSAAGFLARMREICAEVGVPPSSLKIRLAEP